MPAKVAARRSGMLALAVAALLAIVTSFFLRQPTTPEIPLAPMHFLEDQAGLLSPEFAAAKDQYIQHLSRTMRIAQINVVILTHVPSGALEDFTARAATAWRVGVGGVDNGLILFIFRDERMLRLEVGYGLESVITDALAYQLLSENVVPAFARGEFEAGVEDFLDVLDKTLEASEAASHRASPIAAMLPFVMNVLRSAPRVATQVWRTFLAADIQGRLVLSLFGLTIAAVFVRALVGVGAGIPPMVMLPWRLYSSHTLRTINTAAVREQFTAKNFFARPPPFLTGLFRELQLGAVVHAIYLLAGIVVGIAFLFVGSSALVGGLGHYGGAGASVAWPSTL
jgi:uncharacterized protein